MLYAEKGNIRKSAHFVLSPLCLALLGFTELVPVSASVPCVLPAPKAGLALGRRFSGVVLCVFPHCQASPVPRTQRGTEMVPKWAQGERMGVCWLLAPPALVQYCFLLLAGRTGSLVSQSHPAGPERDKPAVHTVPCFFHRFCVSISTELMNNSNMNIIHCIWAGVMSDREEIKSSKRLAGSGPARAGEGWWESDERLRAHTIPTRASDTQPRFRAA